MSTRFSHRRSNVGFLEIGVADPETSASFRTCAQRKEYSELNLKEPDDTNPNHRTETLRFRVSRKEKAEIRDRAARAGMGFSAFCRSRVRLDPGTVVKDVEPTRKSPKMEQRDEIIRNLLAIGVNLNQITRVANSTGEIRRAKQLDHLIDQINAVIPELK